MQEMRFRRHVSGNKESEGAREGGEAAEREREGETKRQTDRDEELSSGIRTQRQARRHSSVASGACEAGCSRRREREGDV